MQRYLFNHLSNTEFILLVMGTVLVMAFMMSLFSRKFLSSIMSYENNRFLGFFIGTVTANYAFILGFTVVMLWRELHDVKSIIAQEAGYLALLVYNAPAFPDAFQSELMKGVEQYIKLILQEEWPAMRLGKVSENAVHVFSNLFHTIQSYSPETKIESVFYNQLVNNLNKVIEFRRKRFEYLESSIPDALRFIFLFGLCVILFLVSLLESESRRLKILTTILVCSMLSLNLSVALLLDYPYTGLESGETDLFSVNSDAFKEGILERFNPENKKEIIDINPSK